MNIELWYGDGALLPRAHPDACARKRAPSAKEVQERGGLPTVKVDEPSGRGCSPFLRKYTPRTDITSELWILLSPGEPVLARGFLLYGRNFLKI
jgi:hypothetical protein